MVVLSATANHFTPVALSSAHMSMSPAELLRFLDRTQPALVGVVGTVRKNGSPHVVPVWYRWDGEAVLVWTDEGRGWVRNAVRDPRVAFSVQEPEAPYAAVVMHGEAEVRTSGDPETEAEIRRITARYIEEAQVDEYIAGWAELRTILTIRPSSINSWGRGY
jgi:PPOX class probable F420-dependent enzyme